jgi:hypothetical protein
MKEKELKAALQQQAQLIAQLAGDEEKAAASGAVNFTQLHGLGGLFSGQGVERDILTAHIRPVTYASQLPRNGTTYEDPRFSAITGYTATVGTRPTTSCYAAPYGYVKTCELTAMFGLLRFDTKEMEMDKIILRANRGDHSDLRLRGQVLGFNDLDPSGLNQSQIVQLVTMSEMVIAAVNMERQLGLDFWQGTIATGAMPGLDLQIATGQVDARTGTACPALDSDVKSFGYDDVCGTGRDIVEYLSMLAYYLEWNADRMGLAPVSWDVVMRPELWYELSACWPCRYLTNRCDNAAGASVGIINDSNNIEMRDAMRAGRYIDINGKRYPVYLDTGIYEANSTNNQNLDPGEFASTIYMVPRTVQGSMPVTYLEYLDYRQARMDTANMGGKETFWVTNNGMYSWSLTDHYGWCYVLHLKSEPRVVLRAPQLAGKIQAIKFTPLQHLRSSYPDSAYWQDGGVSVLSSGTRYAVWAGQGGLSGR